MYRTDTIFLKASYVSIYITYDNGNMVTSIPLFFQKARYFSAISNRELPNVMEYRLNHLVDSDYWLEGPITLLHLGDLRLRMKFDITNISIIFAID